MQSQAETTWLLSLKPSERARFLALLSHGLTVAVRVISRGNVEQVIEHLDQLNEAQHQVTGYLSHCVAGSENVTFLPRVVGSVLDLQSPLAHQQSEQAWSYARSEFNAHVA